MMKLLWLGLWFFSLSAVAQGHFQLFKHSIVAPYSSQPRDLYVYLPSGYKKSSVKYPVLYVQDGQNLFDPKRAFAGQTWNALATLNELIERKIITPIIVVAIDNTSERMDEYIPENRGDDYLQYLVETIKPQIDLAFRTKVNPESTGILGSSLGGLISLYAGLKHPETFSLIAALSPSIWVNGRSILSSYQGASHMPRKIYIDSGTVGGEEPQNVVDLYQVLVERGYHQGSNLYADIQDGASHEEKFWAMRLPTALKFLFPLQP
jgi:pullulanase